MSLLLRLISLVAAATVTVAVTLFPRLIATDMHSVPHAWLVLMMIGMSASWVHGFGFEPKNRLLRVIFSPVLAWPAIAIAALQIYT